MAENMQHQSDDEVNDEYGDNEATRKQKPKMDREVSFSSVLSTSSCPVIQNFNSVKSLYPAPNSILSTDLPSSYASNLQECDSIHEIMLRKTHSGEVVFREFSKMLLNIDGGQVSSSSTVSGLKLSGQFSNRKPESRPPSFHVQLSKQRISDGKFFNKEEKLKAKKPKHKLYTSFPKGLEVLQPLEDRIHLPITTKELGRITVAENLMISYDNTFEEKKKLKDDKRVHPDIRLKVGEDSIKYPKIRNLMPNHSSLVGAYCIKILSYDNQHIITFCSSQQNLNGSGGSSKILSTIDRSFKLIEEKKTECQIFPTKKNEKILHVVPENERFIAFRTELDEKGEGIQYRGEVTIPSGDLLLDGGSYVLMKYLILKRFSGRLKFWSMDINGNMCKCEYHIGKICIIHINNIPYKTYRIKKILLRQGKKNDISKSYYLPSGFLIRHEWQDCPFFLHINPISKIPPKIYPNLEEDWMNDVILTAKYLDEKDKRVSEIKTYIGDHPQITNMLKDYLLCLLCNQPENILDYTIDYFLNLFKEK